ncbi:MAG: hypothetical protein KJ893_03640 [Candidatus Omnitrophica bacterium]|nr:hypothetical protein [Candidatus Omnitrophota bacterium]MBU4477587.1 hypothetical protein [Candidatus Omnitrophota bacterium]
MAEQNSDFKRFFVRLGVTVAAVVLVMYLAKVWFIDQQANIQKISKYSFVYSRGNSQPAIRSLKFTLTGYLFCGIFL